MMKGLAPRCNYDGIIRRENYLPYLPNTDAFPIFFLPSIVLARQLRLQKTARASAHNISSHVSKDRVKPEKIAAPTIA